MRHNHHSNAVRLANAGRVGTRLVKEPTPGLHSLLETIRGRLHRKLQVHLQAASNTEELRACTQGSRETLRAYIQRWTILRNSAEEIPDESAIDAFRRGLLRINIKEELGRLKPKTVSELLEHANRWVDGEDSILNEQCQQTHEDEDLDQQTSYGHGRGFDRRRKRLRTTTTTATTLRWLRPGSLMNAMPKTAIAADSSAEASKAPPAMVLSANRRRSGDHAGLETTGKYVNRPSSS